MVKNLEELLVEATKWANDAKNELKKKVEDFIETTGSSEEELAGVLGISLGEMEQILHGNGEVTITTLSKLLVATNNAVEIKPVEETPIGRYGTATTTHEHPSNQFLRATATPPSRDELPEGRFTPHVNPSQFDFDDDIDDFGDDLDEEIGDGFDEEIDDTKPYTIFDPEHTWKRKTITNFKAVKIRKRIFDKGELCYEMPEIDAIKNRCKEQLETLWDEVKRFENPHTYYVDLSEKLWECKQALLRKEN